MLAVANGETAGMCARTDAGMRWDIKRQKTYKLDIFSKFRQTVFRARVWRTSWVTRTVSVSAHSLATIARPSQSLPTLLEVRSLWYIKSGRNIGGDILFANFSNKYRTTFSHLTFLGIAGAIIFLILLVLLVWMICVRATRPKKQEKVRAHKAC